MKILIIESSSHKNGSSNLLADNFKDNLKAVCNSDKVITLDKLPDLN